MRVVTTPSAFPTLSRGCDGATGVLSEVGMPPKRSVLRSNSVVGVAIAEGLSRWLPAWLELLPMPQIVPAVSAAGPVDGGAAAGAHPPSAQPRTINAAIRRTTSVSAPAEHGQASLSANFSYKIAASAACEVRCTWSESP